MKDNRFDLEAMLYMFTLNLKEEKKKQFSKSSECDMHKVYLFKDYEEFSNYFSNNGIVSICDETLLKLCIMKQTKKGTIISMKKLCDHTIEKCADNHLKKNLEKLTPKKVEEIHSRGKITFLEKVAEWESWDLCAPGDAIGSAAIRCHTFDNCHECLLNFASNNIEHDKFDFKPIISHEEKEKVKTK